MVARLLFILLGTVCLIVGILGIFVPLLPATPFLLFASACYVRGSPTLHRWLRSHRIWERNRSASENLTLAIRSPYGIPCPHGNTSCIPQRGLGTDPT